MASRDDIVAFLDQELAVKEVADPYCPNGLQVEGSGEVQTVGLAVDACLQSFEALADCQLIITHHGLFWPSLKSVTGPIRRSLGFLIQHDISLYGVHLPLDVHAEYGNNVRLLRRLGWEPSERFDQVGWLAEGQESSPEHVARDLEAVLGSKVRLLAFGGSKVRRLAVSSGGGSIGLLVSAQKAGADLVITGEASHPIYHAAKELGVNLILAGHYHTETWGVQALGPLLEEKFGVTTRFVDFPTGF
jgi:dinuclear metal center YbgI/SA1388 family protein